MNVSLTPELEDLVSQKVESGMYQTASEVVREGLRLLKERDEENDFLRREIQAGIEDIEQGRYTVYNQSNLKELFEGVKARGRKRLAEQGPQPGIR